MALSAWLVASLSVPDLDVAWDGAATQTVASGTYYLRHATPASSLLEQVRVAMGVGVLAPAVTMLRNRRVRLSGANSFDIDFLDPQLGRLLGFANDTYPTATSHVAENVSPLLWSPGWLATPTTLEGTAGYVVNDRAVLRSTDMSRQQVDQYHEGVFQELEWSDILVGRMRVADSLDGGGTFHTWLETAAKLGYRFTWYVQQDESSSATPVVWDDANSFGPYVLRLDRFDDDWYRRNVPAVDLYSPLELPLMLERE